MFAFPRKKWWAWLLLGWFSFVALRTCIDTSGTQQGAASRPPLSAEEIMDYCAPEAGIPQDDPKHVITPPQMKRLTDCIDRHRRAEKERS